MDATRQLIWAVAAGLAAHLGARLDERQANQQDGDAVDEWGEDLNKINVSVASLPRHTMCEKNTAVTTNSTAACRAVASLRRAGRAPRMAWREWCRPSRRDERRPGPTLLINGYKTKTLPTLRIALGGVNDKMKTRTPPSRMVPSALPYASSKH